MRERCANPIFDSSRLLLVTVCSAFFLLCSPFALVRAATPVTVDIQGVRAEMLENVEAALRVPEALAREGKVDSRWLARFRRQIPEKVRQALAPFGYFQPDIETDLENPAPDEYRLLVRINPGAPVRVEKINVVLTGPGAEQPALQDLLAAFPLQKGDVLRQSLYDQTKGALKARALDLGYLDADFTAHAIRVNRVQGTAAIDLALDTGPRFHFGAIDIAGGENYPRRFLRRYLAFAPDDVFSFAKLGQTQLNFLDSDRFQGVVVTPREEEAVDHRVPVTILLTPSLPKRLRPGIGYATDTGARFTLRYKDVNAFQLGHEIVADLLIAEAQQSIGAGYIVPSRKNIDSLTAFRVGYDDEDVDTYESRTYFAEVERRRSFGGGKLGSVYLRVLQESYTVGKDSSDSSFLVLPGLRYSRRGYGSSARPEKGYFYSLETRGTHQALGSDTGLLQLVGAANQLFSLPGRFSFFVRGQAGWTIQSEPLRDIPPSLRFFAGGDKSVRGYAYESLGPENEDGDVIGGKNLLVGSVELERALWDDWGVAAFYDAGNAFNDFGDITFHQGAGLGVRWYTPVGPVKIDVARQVGAPDPSFRLHISIGFGW
ncbi:MAG: autotransporter assembly complex family protein [Desulfuromonadales bacterium]